MCFSLATAAATGTDVDVAYTMGASASVVEAGDTFTVTVSLSENVGFKAATVTVRYDSTQFSYVSYSAGTFSDLTVNKQNEGTVKVAVGNALNAITNFNAAPTYNGTGTVAVLTFKASEHYEGTGSIELSVTSGNCLTLKKDFSYRVSGASVAVKSVDFATHVHDEEDIAAVEPTCTETGLTAGKRCRFCERFTVPQTVVPTKGHQPGDLIAKVDATCEATGTNAHYKCSVCDVLLDENKAETTEKALTVPAKGHNLAIRSP